MEGAPHRLQLDEARAIVESVRAVVPTDVLRSVFLFGSRANLSAKGGDIDLWVQCEREQDVDLAWTRKIRTLIHDRLGEQKIDIVLSGPLDQVSEPGKRAFLEQISSKKVELWRKSPAP